MARERRKVGGTGNYKKYNTYVEGDYIVGKFLNSGIDTTYGKPYYVFELESFSFQNPVCCSPASKDIEEGMCLTLNSAGSLDVKMKEIAPGETVEIVYNGTQELPSDHKFKGKEAHQFDVFTLGDEVVDESEAL